MDGEVFAKVVFGIYLIILILVINGVYVFFKRLSEISEYLKKIDAKLDRFIALQKKKSEE